jgi:hypothetical protein
MQITFLQVQNTYVLINGWVLQDLTGRSRPSETGESFPRISKMANSISSNFLSTPDVPVRLALSRFACII